MDFSVVRLEVDDEPTGELHSVEVFTKLDVDPDEVKLVVDSFKKS